MDSFRGHCLEVPSSLPHSMGRTGKAQTPFIFREWGRDGGQCGTMGGLLPGGMLQSHHVLSPLLKGSRSPQLPGRRSSPVAPRLLPSWPTWSRAALGSLRGLGLTWPRGRPVDPWHPVRGIDEP